MLTLWSQSPWPAPASERPSAWNLPVRTLLSWRAGLCGRAQTDDAFHHCVWHHSVWHHSVWHHSVWHHSVWHHSVWHHCLWHLCVYRGGSGNGQVRRWTGVTDARAGYRLSLTRLQPWSRAPGRLSRRDLGSFIVLGAYLARYRLVRCRDLWSRLCVGRMPAELSDIGKIPSRTGHDASSEAQFRPSCVWLERLYTRAFCLDPLMGSPRWTKLYT